MNQHNKTIYDLLINTKRKLKDAGIKPWHLDAELLLIKALSIKNREELLLIANKKTATDLTKLDALIKRRLNGEPIAYILGKKEFWNFTFEVNKNTLIPRPDSETLIEAVIQISKAKNWIKKPLEILDLGTGSGCLLLTLLKILPNAKGVGVDISEEAIEVAKRNMSNLELENRAKFIKSNWFDLLKPNEKFDIIISNPPYIPLNEWKNLPKNVKEYEPKISLTDAAGGLSHYQTILNNVESYCKGSVIIALEVGYNQSEAVLNIAKKTV